MNQLDTFIYLRRLSAAAVSAAYIKPLFDLGTRVHRNGTMGCDIRLVGPETCLLCFGGVNGENVGLELLESPDAEELFQSFRDWQEERPGSLRPLNELACALAQNILLQYLLLGRMPPSLWCHIESGQDGRMIIEYPVPTRDQRPCFCDILGWGDAGLSHATSILRRRQHTTANLRFISCCSPAGALRHTGRNR